MKQILQDLNSGETRVAEVPAPNASSGGILVSTTCSLVSAGTERMLVEFGRGNLLQKARQQPDKVKQVLAKVQTDGVIPTLETVKNKLSTPIALGYCNVGVVVESRCEDFKVGERVVSNGQHAEYVAVGKNLAARVPDGVDDDSAAFTVIAAIALQGIRLINPTLGEHVVVTGLGLIGLVAVQLLRANGCRVLGIDFDPEKLALAKQFGAETVDLSKAQDPIAVAEQFSRGRGVDAVLITASSKSNEPIHQAATMCRKRGRIVLVGVVGMEMSRADFYEKELTFQVSCSYGPGRYDSEYEEKGIDYPIGFVRWTEQRNFEAVLDMMAEGRLDLRPLVSHRFQLEQASRAYELINTGNPLGVLLEYAREKPAEVSRTVALQSRAKPVTTGSAPSLGFIGAGSYASSVLVPAFAKTGAHLKNIASKTGISGVHVGEKYGIETATTDAESIFSAEDIDAVVITTRHDSHASWILRGLESGKHVFVEKPVALSRTQLQELECALDENNNKNAVMVGFNRRYSPLIAELKSALDRAAQPASFSITVNAGSIPSDHWTQDPEIGGGRIIGEACHFVDLLRYLAASPVATLETVFMRSSMNDTLKILMAFDNGSIGSIDYLANGNKAYPKERVEVFCGGGIAIVDNFRALKSIGWRGLKSRRLMKQDKGQKECARQFVSAIETGNFDRLIPFQEIKEVAEICFTIAESAG